MSLSTRVEQRAIAPVRVETVGGVELQDMWFAFPDKIVQAGPFTFVRLDRLGARAQA